MRRSWWLVILLSGCTTFWTGDIDPVPAPPLDAVAVDGSLVNLTADGPVLIDFMGTWCGPCQRAVPVLRDLQAAYPTLTVISVSATDTPDQLMDFQGRYGAHWPHVADDWTIADAYRENGSRAPTMLWPSYALVVDGQLVFYNRGETLPSTFARAIDRHVDRQAPQVTSDAVLPVATAFALGAMAWFSPWLLPVIREAPRRRPDASLLLPVVLFGALAVIAAYGSRPLSGRVATVAPFLAAAGLIAVVYWRWRGDVQARGKRLDGEGWRHAWALHGNLWWYALPVWGAVLHAALLRTAPLESLLVVAAFGLGVAASEVYAHRRQVPKDAAWLGAAALLIGAAWNAWLYIR